MLADCSTEVKDELQCAILSEDIIGLAGFQSDAILTVKKEEDISDVSLANDSEARHYKQLGQESSLF